MKKIIILISICFLLSSCDDLSLYKIEKAKDGTVYRMHRFTGEMTIMKDGKIQTEREMREIKAYETIATQPKEWNYTIDVLDKAGVNIQIKWLDGKLYYKLYLSPVGNTLLAARKREIRAAYWEKKNPAITINFKDSDFFKLISENIYLLSMTNIIDENEKTSALSYQHSISCDKDTYRLIMSSDITWSLPD